MITRTARKIVRLVSIVMMVALTFAFAHTMAQSYYSSLQCMTDMSVACPNTPTSDDAYALAADNNPATDEWLCAQNEISYCGANQVQGLEVVQLNTK